jgi:hypothetical protein
MAKANPKNPQKRSSAKPTPRSQPPNNIEGDINGGAFVQGENHGTVIAVNGGDKQNERFNSILDGITERLLSDLESNYNRKGGKKE